MSWTKSIPPVIVQNRLYVFLALGIITLFALLKPFGGSDTPQISPTRYAQSSSSSSPREAAANRTLGFEKILALSPGPSWRTRGLDTVGQAVGLEFTYPPQPHNPNDLITAFSNIGKAEGKTTPAQGSAKAWLAHVDLLKYFIMSGLESALIVEDDVDFDVRLMDQIRLVSDNVRAYTNVPATDFTAYGNNWDILWLGHCGTSMVNDNPGRRYLDETRCKTDLYSGWSKRFIREYLEEDHRIIQWAGSTTVCSFGFAVHKGSAQKVLDITAKGADEAYDVAFSHACGSGALKCLVVNPQIMNHYEPPRDAGYLSPVHVGDGQGASADDSAFENKDMYATAFGDMRASIRLHWVASQNGYIIEVPLRKAITVFAELDPGSNGVD